VSDIQAQNGGFHGTIKGSV